MRPIILRILVCLMALLGVALIAGSIFLRHRLVLLHRAASSGAHDFLVAERGSLILARQRVTAAAGSSGDASQFGQYALNIGSNMRPLTFSANHVVVQGNKITLIADPITPNMKRGFVFLNLDSGSVVPTPAIQLVCRAIGAPMWVLGVPLLLPATIVLIRRGRRSRRRHRRGLCQACGYDLRASPDRCPECGLTPHSASDATPVPVAPP